MADHMSDDDCTLEFFDEAGNPLLTRHPLENTDRGDDQDIEVSGGPSRVGPRSPCILSKDCFRQILQAYASNPLYFGETCTHRKLPFRPTCHGGSPSP